LGVWYDVNGDGKLDVVSAKTNLPVGKFFQLNYIILQKKKKKKKGSDPDGKLVWYENPGYFSHFYLPIVH